MNIEELFIVCGARRTGTTLLAAILSADEATPPLPGEAQLLPQWLNTYRWAKQSFSIRALPFFADENEFSQFYRHILLEFLGHCGSHFEFSSSVIWKSPELSLYFQEAWELLPEAHFLVTARDPRDQVASEWRVVEKRNRGEENLRILRERDFRCLAKLYNRYYRPMLELIERHPDRIFIQRYEELVLAPEQAITRIEDFTGLDLSGFNPLESWPRVADSYWAYGTGPSDTPFYGKAIERSRVGSFEESMTADEAAAVEKACEQTASVLGYPLDRRGP